MTDPRDEEYAYLPVDHERCGCNLCHSDVPHVALVF